MSLIIHHKRLPKPLLACRHQTDIQTTGTGLALNFAEAPYVMGDLWQMRGWLEGLGLGYIEGSLSVILHEGLWEINGELTVYGAATLHNFKTIQEFLHRALLGLAGRYPTSNYRYTVTYAMEWDAKQE